MDRFWDCTKRTTNYEKTIPTSVGRRTFDLERMNALMSFLGNPQNSYPTIQVAGTNGKGSVVRITEAVLRHSGVRAGVFLSPHLVSIRERIQVAGQPVSEDLFLEHFDRMEGYLLEKEWTGDLLDRPTFFEILTALAMSLFEAEGVSLALFEVGLGGRLDSTNILNPEVCALTEIGMDHASILGETLAEIATEKAAIIDPKAVVVSGVTPPAAREVVQNRVKMMDGTLYEVGKDLVVDPVAFIREVGTRFHIRSWNRGYSRLDLPIPGLHHLHNVAVSVGLLECLRDQGRVRWGSAQLRPALAELELPGRCQVVERDPLILLDGCHNVDALTALLQVLSEYFPDRETGWVFGVVGDKEYEKMLDLIVPRSRWMVVTRVESPRSVDPQELARGARKRGMEKVAVARNGVEALQKARTLVGSKEMVVTAGSLYLVGELLRERGW